MPSFFWTLVPLTNRSTQDESYSEVDLIEILHMKQVGHLIHHCFHHEPNR